MAFVLSASTTDMDPDGEMIDAGAFVPLPESIPVHSAHRASVDNLVARAVQSSEGGRLVIDATFASTPDAQAVRQKVLDGVLDTVSVAFNATRKSVTGVTHITSGELLSVDLVTIPSNRSARVLSVRSYNGDGRCARRLAAPAVQQPNTVPPAPRETAAHCPRSSLAAAVWSEVVVGDGGYWDGVRRQGHSDRRWR